MELSQDLFEQIDDYLEGQLSEKKLQKFEQELQTNQELVTAVARQKKIILSIRKSAIFDLKNTLNDIHEEVVVNEKPPITALGFWKPALLLVTVFAVLGLIYCLSPNNEDSPPPKSMDKNIPVATNDDPNEEKEINFGNSRRKINVATINGHQDIYLNIQSSTNTNQFVWKENLLTLYLIGQKPTETMEVILIETNKQQFELKIDTVLYKVFPTDVKMILKKD